VERNLLKKKKMKTENLF